MDFVLLWSTSQSWFLVPFRCSCAQYRLMLVAEWRWRLRWTQDMGSNAPCVLKEADALATRTVVSIYFIRRAGSLRCCWFVLLNFWKLCTYIYVRSYYTDLTRSHVEFLYRSGTINHVILNCNRFICKQAVQVWFVSNECAINPVKYEWT